MKTARQIGISLLALVAIAIFFRFYALDWLFPRDDFQELLSGEDVRQIESGGTIDQTNVAFAGADHVCLVGERYPRQGIIAGCPQSHDPAIALISGGRCKLYNSHAGIASLEYDLKCKPVARGFRLGAMISDTGMTYLIFK